jgi:glycolate oxidase iron-sulfur subunit
VQRVLAPNINHSIKNILAKLGYETTETPQKQCCGAIDQHLSAGRDALIKIKCNIDAWLHVEAAVIISSASGCGLMVKDYPSLFDELDPYYQKAKSIALVNRPTTLFLWRFCRFIAKFRQNIFNTMVNIRCKHTLHTTP